MAKIHENLFVGLRDACFRCGGLQTAPNCNECKDLPPLDQPVDTFVGARVGTRSNNGIVVAVEGGNAEVLLEGGRAVNAAVVSFAERHRLNTGRSIAEQLLAASYRWRPPAALDDALCARAISEASRASSFVRLRFAEAARFAGKAELIEQLDPPEDTRTWLDAVDMVRRDRSYDAATTLLTIPGPAFPARIGVWMHTLEALDADIRRQLQGVLSDLEGLSIAVDAAVLTLRIALDDRESNGDAIDSTLQQLDRCLSTSHDELHTRLGQRLRGSNGLPEATLVGGLEGSTSMTTRQAHLLLSAPATLIDDLIDDGTIDATWLDEPLTPRVRDHIAARTDPSRLSDDALATFSLADERVRRAVLAGDKVPEDLPDSVTKPLGDLIELTQSDEPAQTALAILSRREDPAAPALAHALQDPSTPPSDDLLGSAIARFGLGAASVECLDTRGLRRSDLSARQQEYVGTILLERAKGALLDWRYNAAVDDAKTCLRLTSAEAIRDEALNLLACGDWQLGDDESAIGALETALKDAYTYPLQANFAVVAQTLEPERAAYHLTRLIDDAPDLRLKVAAAKRALVLWQSTELSREQDDDLPTDFAQAIRSLVTAPIDESDLRLFLRLLADHDPTWLKSRHALAASPHADSEAVRLYVARARSFEDYIRELATLLSEDQAPSWLAETRDGLLGSIIGALGDEEPALGALSIADLCLDSDMPMELRQWITLRGLMAATVARAIFSSGDGEPALRFLDNLEVAKAALPQIDDPDERDAAAAAVDWGFRALAIAYTNNRWSELEQAGELHDKIAYVVATTSMFQRNRSKMKQRVQQIRQVADDTFRLVTRLRPNVDENGQKLLDGALEASGRLRTLAEQLQRKV